MGVTLVPASWGCYKAQAALRTVPGTLWALNKSLSPIIVMAQALASSLSAVVCMYFCVPLLVLENLFFFFLKPSLF